MDLNTDPPGALEISGRATGRMCCDPAFGFAPQLTRRDAAPVESNVRCDAGARERREATPPAFVAGEGAAIQPVGSKSGLAVDDRAHSLKEHLKIQDDERIRLGRELHDSIGQLLLALRLDIAHLKRVRGTPVEGRLLDEIEKEAGQIDTEIRSFAFLRYPAEFGCEGLAEALDNFSRGFAVRTGIRIKFVDLCGRHVRNGPSAVALLRVAQEALMNIHRHARAAHARVTLKLRDRLLSLIVSDDGIGIASAAAFDKSHGVGLPGMRQRVECLGGDFSIKRLKRGTRLVASVPIA